MRSSRTTVDVHSVHSFALSAEGQCLSACTLHSCTVHGCLQALVTDAPTHSRWLKVATEQSCIRESAPVVGDFHDCQDPKDGGHYLIRATSMEKPWLRLVATLTCRSFAILGLRVE